MERQISKYKLLLIEDDEEFAHNLRIRLSKEKWQPFDVAVVPTLQEAVAALAQDYFTIILLDISLPDSGGLETYFKIQEISNSTPIVILTGWDDNELALEALRQGAEDYLVKGEVDGRMISRVLHHAIERHRIKMELDQVSRELKESNQQLEKMAILDPLTELLNRRGLQQVLSREMEWAKRHHRLFPAMVVDIDLFKQLNDTFGYAVGDILLREMAQALKDCVRLTDHVARIGGDEFILLLPETEYAEAVRIAERVRTVISNRTFLISKQKKIKMTASVGLVMITEQTTCTDELIERVYPFLKRSKDEGRNRVSYDSEDFKIDFDSAYSPSQHLNMMRDENEFMAVKQPIFRLADHEIVGYEFLSRLKNGSLSMPQDFFRVALENNILTLVDCHCFRTCVRAASAIASHLSCSINLFPSTMIDVPIQHLIGLLPHEIPSEKYCIEISEQQILGDPTYLVETIEAIKEAGVLIAIDDVGFGYSSLESLIAFEPDIIKLDQKYVNGVSGNERRLRSLSRILKIAADLNAKVVAEGIESEEDLESLKKLGVQYGQGFCLGRPL